MQGATTRLLEYLKENGPQSYRQLDRLPFWGGVRSRFYDLIKQGRIQKCDIANPYSGPHMRAVVIGYKVREDVFTGDIRLRYAERRRAEDQAKKEAKVAKEAKKAEQKELKRKAKILPRIAAAKEFLESNGYTVTHK